MKLDLISDLGGVPTEDRFRNLTSSQWEILINHYLDKKDRKREEFIQLFEYHAMLTSMNPKAVQKITQARKRQLQTQENINDENRLVVNNYGYNDKGNFVNTTFYKDIEKYAGKEVLENLGIPEEYVAPEEELEKPFGEMDENEKFIFNAKKIFKQHEQDLKEEAKYKKEHPELFETGDSVIF